MVERLGNPIAIFAKPALNSANKRAHKVTWLAMPTNT